MSCSTLWAVYKTKACSLREFRNGFGSGPPAWDLLWSRYIERGRHFPSFVAGAGERLWPLAGDSRVSDDHRILLATTFDHAVIPDRDVHRVASALRNGHADILAEPLSSEYSKEPPAPWTWSHWASIADALEEEARHKDKRRLGFAIGCTSVSDPWEEYVTGTETYTVMEAARLKKGRKP